MTKLRRSFKARVLTLAAIATCAIAVDACKNSQADVPFDTGWTHEENSAIGRSYFSAKTFVDCAHTRVGYKQSADIFTGGYAHDVAGNVVSYADMGILLENNDLQPGQIAAPNKVQLYGQGSTKKGTELIRFTNEGHASQRFFNVVCDTPLTLTFWIESDRKIDIRYDGTFVSKFGGKRFVGSLTTSIDGFAPEDGWSTACTRCQVRRVTTMAVSSGTPTRPGAYFAIRDRDDGTREPAGAWRDSVEGTYSNGPAGDATSYALTPFSANLKDVNDEPRNAQRSPVGRPEFLIRKQGLPNEEFGIDQRPLSH